MQEAIIAIFILLHVVFTPIESPKRQSSVEVYGIYQKGEDCVAALRATNQQFNPATNSFGCVRVEHPAQEQREHKHDEGSRGRGGA